MQTSSVPKVPVLQCGVCGGSSRSSKRDTVLLALRASTALLVILLGLLACKPADNIDSREQVYRSIWAQLYPDSLQRKLDHDTLQGAFNFAAEAEAQSTAEERWSSFLANWKPENGEFEDAMQANLVTWAELEMQRLHYLRQNNESALKAIDEKLRNLAADFQ